MRGNRHHNLLGMLALGFAIGVSLYLAWTSLSGGKVAGCTAAEGGCQDVLSSRWGSVLGVPISLLGLPIYGAILILAVFRLPWAREALPVLSLLVIGAALWFGAVQLIILQAFCPWCCATHSSAVLGTLLLWRSRRRRQGPGRGHVGLAWGVAVAAVAGLAVLQAVGPAPPETKRASLAGAGAEQASGGSLIALHAGRFVVDPMSLPTIGSPGAGRAAVALTDYTCGYCRKLHTQLARVVRSYPAGQVCVVELPVARNAAAAEIQRLMLSIWRVDPAAKAALESEIYEGRLAADPISVRAAAESLLGAERLAAAMSAHREWADLQILQASEILEANRLVTGVAHLPQLVVGEEVSVGASRDLQVYLDLFEEHLELDVPSRESLALAEPDFGPIPRGRTEAARPPPVPARPVFRPAGIGGGPTEIPAGYFAWMLEHFEMPGEIALAGPGENPELDDAENAIEYWCRLDPRKNDAPAGRAGRAMHGDAGELIFALELRDDDRSLQGFVEFADDLHFERPGHTRVDFDSLAPFDPDPGDGLLSWFATDPLGKQSGERFARSGFTIAWPPDGECVRLCAAVAVNTCQSDPLKLRDIFHACVNDCAEGRCAGGVSPVCGCDGQTYESACEAAAANAAVAHLGSCGSPPCRSSADCGAADYCQFEDGCGGVGMCRVRPLGCPDVWDPVCGCDGQTYGNACDAAAEGMNVAQRGVCPPSPCRSNSDCAIAAYCAVEDGCEGVGTCRDRPRACPRNYDPVCGCDGKTYSNACEAAAAGINVARRGTCEMECRSNGDCDGGDYCANEAGCDGPGICQERPQACPENFDPVCGCDGVTYSNACFAAAAGVNVVSRGVCPEPCDANDDCGRGEYCALDDGCDGPGLCRERPQICLAVWDPVCGCDGLTYGNPCEAASAGMNIARDGACEAECGGNADCAQGEYCLFVEGCAGEGLCQVRPQICTLEFDPVCGCDGVTYGNACEAAAAGATVASRGFCPEAGEP